MGIKTMFFLFLTSIIIYKLSSRSTRYLLIALLSLDIVCRIIIFVLNFELSLPFFIFLFLFFQIVLTLSLIKKFNFEGISTRAINLSILSIAFIVIFYNLYFTIEGSLLPNQFYYNTNHIGNLLFDYKINRNTTLLWPLTRWQFIFFDIFTTILATIFFYFEEFKPSVKFERPQQVEESHDTDISEIIKTEPTKSIEYYVVVDNE